MTRPRWFILTLLFLVTTSNHLDRIVFSVLIPVIRNDLHISTRKFNLLEVGWALPEFISWRTSAASVAGIGGCFGGLGGVLFSSLLPGYVVSHFGHTPIFLGMGLLHLTALLIVHKMLGRMELIRA
jgi:nitrate/nitrite transporter NarK